MISLQTIDQIFSVIPTIKEHHHLSSKLYQILDAAIQDHFSAYNGGPIHTRPFNGLIWPHHSLGQTTSYEIFGMYLWILYSFYWMNRDRYKTFFDFGANVGQDAVILSKMGYEVHAFEPDEESCSMLRKNAEINRCDALHIYRKAVAEASGTAELVKVKGNYTASHIDGFKDSYGELEKVRVDTISLDDIPQKPDLVKFNIEGYEKQLIPAIPMEKWRQFDTLLEIHDEPSQQAVYHHFENTDLNMFSQKTGWQPVQSLDDVPKTHREGHLFVSTAAEMPWGQQLRTPVS